MRVVAAAVCGAALAQPIRAADGCVLLPHGDFVDGLAGWTIDVVDQSGDGDAFAEASAVHFDGSDYGDPPIFDPHTLAIAGVAVSGAEGLPGAAAVEIVASTTTTAEARFLRMKRGGGFEFQFQGAAGRELRVAFEAQTADGRTARTLVYESLAEPAEVCEPGLAVLGTFDAPEPRVQLDLNAAGIVPGEVVTVSIRVRLAAETPAACQFLVNEAFLIVDRVEFCHARLFRGDLNCDGAADFFDIDPFLLALFDPSAYRAANPFCDIMNGDLNADGRVNFFDIDPFVACIFGTCVQE